MLNNITNFASIIAKRRFKKSLEPKDVIAVGTKQSRSQGDFKPTGIQYEDLLVQVLGEIPPIPEPVDPAINYSTVAWVDNTNGNNSTGELGRFDKPFSSHLGALNAINAVYSNYSNATRALIYVRAGNYLDNILLRSRIDTYCEPGVVYRQGSRMTDITYGSLDGIVECAFLGHASYINPGSNITNFVELTSNSEVHLEFDQFDSFSGPIFFGGSGSVYFRCRKIETLGYFKAGGISFRNTRNIVMDIKEQIRSSAATIKIRQYTGTAVVNCPKMICSDQNFLGGNLKQVVLTENATNATVILNGDLIQEDSATYFGGIGAVVTIWSGGAGNYTINGNIYANNSRAGIGQLSTGAVVKLNGSIITKRRAAELNTGTTVFNNGYLVNQNVYAVADPIVSIAGGAVGYFKDVSMHSGADLTNAVTMTTNTSTVRMFNCLYSGVGLGGNIIESTVDGANVQIHNVRSTKDKSVTVTDQLTPTGLIVDTALITPNFI